MSVSSKKSRKQQRAVERARCNDPRFTDERLREFVAVEIPSLAGDGEWTPAQRRAIADIYAQHLDGQPWTCWMEGCARVVEHFGDVCARCQAGAAEDEGDSLGPVDWDSIGV